MGPEKKKKERVFARYSLISSWLAYSMHVGWQHILHLSQCKAGENNRKFGLIQATWNLEGNDAHAAQNRKENYLNMQVRAFVESNS